jgi:hypothetical protein
MEKFICFYMRGGKFLREKKFHNYKSIFFLNLILSLEKKEKKIN